MRRVLLPSEGTVRLEDEDENAISRPLSLPHSFFLSVFLFLSVPFLLSVFFYLILSISLYLSCIYHISMIWYLIREPLT